MTFDVFQDKNQGAYFVVTIISAVLTTIAVALRFIATRRTGRKLGLEDWLALAATIVFLARIGNTLRALIIINGRLFALAFDRVAYEESFKVCLEPRSFVVCCSADAMVHGRLTHTSPINPQGIFVSNLITLLDQTLAKLSICALYHRIFGINRKYRLWIWALAILQILLYIALVILQCLQCTPIAKQWQWWTEGVCLPFATILVAIEPINSVIDFALVVLAMFMIKSLHMKSGVKWKLRFLFALGGLAGIFGFIKVGLAYSPDTVQISAVLGLWAMVQSLACIVCACAPVYKPLLPETGLWNRLKSKVSNISLTGGRSKQGSQTGGGSKGGSGLPSNSSQTSTNSQKQGWLRLDWATSKGQAWSEQRTVPANAGEEHHEMDVPGVPGYVPFPTPNNNSDHAIYPLRTIQVQRTYDVV
ncbi:hypothetical protein B0T17DRAFT_203135 [Bombardia bombarda]|uniref:Rhodopsin domain-containing protein n=1 Tax=Bombardia bombarda TaxID=252184 RepID=A0AA39XA51_9PEZI|nr:hypothetical protein B0T17DRAFT_203135 [Bombardia bombarda]